MKPNRSAALAGRARRVGAAALALVFAVVLAACGGGGTTPVTGVQLRPLPADFSTRKAVNYSPYRTARNESELGAEVITEANIKQDLDLLVAAGFGLIRLFDSSDKIAKATLDVIYKYDIDMRVQLGTYLQSDKSAAAADKPVIRARRQAELARAVALANDPKYRDIILTVSIGNENMVSWTGNPIDPADIAEYLQTVRAQIRQPITTDDDRAFYTQAPSIITDRIDFASIHIYAVSETIPPSTTATWDWRQKSVDVASRATAMMDAAMAATKVHHDNVRAHLDSKGLTAMPITIGEIGWNTSAAKAPLRAHPVNQKLFLERLDAWAAQGRTGSGPKAIFYFEAFDEPWKQADDFWGLFNKDRKARCAIQERNPASATWVYDTSVSCAATAAVSWVPPVVGTAVTEDLLKLVSDAPATPSEAQATGLKWDPYDRSSVFITEKASAAAPGDGSLGLELAIVPADYGWGALLYSATGATLNVSNYAATGGLKFWVKTAYAGKIQIRVLSDTDDRDEAGPTLVLGNGDFGWCNTNQWCQVSIPISAIQARDPKFDPRLVKSFVIADVFSETGNTQKTGLPVINLDGIVWSK